MQTTSWLTYIQAPAETRLTLDRQAAANRRQLEALRAQTEAVHAQTAVLGMIGMEQVAATREVAGQVAGVRAELSSLGALFDWRVERLEDLFKSQTQRLDDVISLLSKPLDTQGRELWDRAQYAAERGWYEEAEQTYQQALEKSPFLYPAHLQLGYIRAYHLGKIDEGLASFRAAARYARQDEPALAAQAHLQLYKFAREQGELAQAREHIEEVCHLTPDVALAWWKRATLDRDEGRLEDLEQSLREAIRLDPLFWHRAEGEVWEGAADRVQRLCAQFQSEISPAPAERLQEEVARIEDLAGQLSREHRYDVQIETNRVKEVPPALLRGATVEPYAVRVASVTTAQKLLTDFRERVRRVRITLTEKIQDALRQMEPEERSLSERIAKEQAVARKSTGIGFSKEILGFGGVFLLVVLGLASLALIFGETTSFQRLGGVLLLVAAVVGIVVAIRWIGEQAREAAERGAKNVGQRYSDERNKQVTRRSELERDLTLLSRFE